MDFTPPAEAGETFAGHFRRRNLLPPPQPGEFA